MLDLEVAIVMGGKKFPCSTVSPALNCTLCTRKSMPSTNESRAEMGYESPRVVSPNLESYRRVLVAGILDRPPRVEVLSSDSRLILRHR